MQTHIKKSLISLSMILMPASILNASEVLSTANITESKGTQNYYTINVPANSTALKVLLSNITGDPDMYVRYGEEPTLSAYDCRPYEGPHTDETCHIDNPQAGTWHIMIDAYKDFSGATLTVTVEDGATVVLPTAPASLNVEALANGYLKVSGIADAGVGVKATFPDGSVAYDAAAADGSFSIISIYSQGSGTISLVATDLPGNSSDVSRIDTVKDGATVVLPTAPASLNVEALANGYIKVSGTADAGVGVKATFPDGSVAYDAAAANGSFSIISIHPQESGTISLVATDLPGNSSDVSTIATVKGGVSGIQSITQQVAHTHANCKGYVTLVGKDLDANGLLEGSEVQTRTPYYEEGTPLTKAELKSKIANNEDVTQVNTCEIEDMSILLEHNWEFNQDIGSWNVGSVTNMSGMFHSTRYFNQDIGSWDVSKVTDMHDMFRDTEIFNQDIGAWDVSNVTDMSGMFNRRLIEDELALVRSVVSFNQDIGAWDVSNVTNMSGMFNSATSFNQDIGAWDVSKVTYMNGVFHGASKFNQNIGRWDVSNVISMRAMFDGAPRFNQDIGAWDVSKVMDMSYMFSMASKFNQNIGRWDVSNVISMREMFNTTIFNQDIGAWDVSKVTNMSAMFFRASKFNQNIGRWDVSKVEDSTRFSEYAILQDTFKPKFK